MPVIDPEVRSRMREMRNRILRNMLRDNATREAYTPEPVTEDKAAALKQAEDAVNGILEAQSPLVLAVLYKTLFAHGYRIGSVDAEIRKALALR